MRRQHFLILATILLVALALLGNSPAFRQQLTNWLNPGERVETLPVSPCDLNQGACTYTLSDERSITLDIQPRPIKPVQNLAVDVQASGLDVRQLSLDLSGTEMDMGFNQSPLTELSNGHFAGQTTIPVCATGKMRWQASLLVDLLDQRIAIPFQFDVGGE